MIIRPNESILLFRPGVSGTKVLQDYAFLALNIEVSDCIPDG